MPKGVYKHHPHQGFQKRHETNKGKKFGPMSEKQKKNLGISMEKTHKSKDFGFRKGVKHLNWKNGQWKDGSGYVRILKPQHPFCNCDGYIKRSRFIMEQIVGRYLTVEEIVHHKNEIRNDDRPENLRLFANKKEHQQYHYKTRARNEISRFIKIQKSPTL